MKMTPALWAEALYFDASEFLHPDQIEASLIARLDAARGYAGIPLVITSAVRTPRHNAAVGGADNSAHLRGFAVDIRCRSSRSRFHVVRGLILAGVHRIVVYQTHVHADVDPTLDPEVLSLG